MKRAVALSMAMLATGAVAGEKKTYNYICNGRRFTVTAVVDTGDVDRWSKTEPVILQIGTEPPQILIADPDAPDADSYKNKDYEFYALKKFITLTHKNHGVVVKFYDTCRIE
ncbi:MAG: hypothetical protein WBE96_20175 [Pseudolabrys sp.]